MCLLRGTDGVFVYDSECLLRGTDWVFLCDSECLLRGTDWAFVYDSECVYCAVRTGSLYIIRNEFTTQYGLGLCI